VNLNHYLLHLMRSQVAGMVAELFEYPFDLAKVRLQAQLLGPTASTSATALRFNGPLDCLLRTWKEEGFRGLYRVCP
jgi:ornithine carrier protein